MLWPPPQRGDSVSLTCGCRATVRMAVPMVFAYVRFGFRYRIRPVTVRIESVRSDSRTWKASSLGTIARAYWRVDPDREHEQ